MDWRGELPPAQHQPTPMPMISQNGSAFPTHLFVDVNSVSGRVFKMVLIHNTPCKPARTVCCK